MLSLDKEVFVIKITSVDGKLTLSREVFYVPSKLCNLNSIKFSLAVFPICEKKKGVFTVVHTQWQAVIS